MLCATVLAMFCWKLCEASCKEIAQCTIPCNAQNCLIQVAEDVAERRIKCYFLYNFNVSQRFWLLQDMLHYAISQATCVGKTLWDRLHETLLSVTASLDPKWIFLESTCDYLSTFYSPLIEGVHGIKPLMTIDYSIWFTRMWKAD